MRQLPGSLPLALLLATAASSPLAAGNAALAVGECGDVNGDGRVDISDPVHLLGFLFLGGDPPTCSIGVDEGAPASCEGASRAATESCRHEAIAGFWTELAKCESLGDADDVAQCRADARGSLDEALEECGAIEDARSDVCGRLGETPYAVEIDPEDFVDTIDHPYLPLVPGTTRVYRSETEDGEVEETRVTVLEETREILGVECTVVHDVVSIDGEVEEDTFDWFAQDASGNVWYFGELSFEYEDGEISSLAGSWEAGVDGAYPGIVMHAMPEPGPIYYQEYLVGEAEDMALVVRMDADVTVPFGSFSECVQTDEFTVLEPGVVEQKYYARGIGFVLGVKVGSGRRDELVDVIEE